MRTKHYLLFLVVVIALLLSACAQQAMASSIGDASDGKILFNQASINNAPGCITCHSVVPDKVIVGPSLAGVATRASGRIPGMSAGDYLHESITNPNAYIVDGFPSGVMYQHFQEALTRAQINNLVAYLMMLK